MGDPFVPFKAPKAPGRKELDSIESSLPLLVGDLGRAREIPTRVDAFGNIQFETLADVRTRDDIARSLQVTFSILQPMPPATNFSLFGMVQFGSAGVQGVSAVFDLCRGVVLSVPGSFLRAGVANINPTAPDTVVHIGCHVTIGDQDNAEAFLIQSVGDVPAAGSVAFNYDVADLGVNAFSLVKDVQLLSTDMQNDTFRAEFRTRGGALPTFFDVFKAPGMMAPRVPLPSNIGTMLVTNLDPVNAIDGVQVYSRFHM